MPWETQNSRLPITASGWVKSTTACDAFVDERLQLVVDIDARDQLEVTFGLRGLLDGIAHRAADLAQRAQHAHLECTHGANLALSTTPRAGPAIQLG